MHGSADNGDSVTRIVGNQVLAHGLHTTVTLSQIGEERECRPAIGPARHLDVFEKTCVEVAVARSRGPAMNLVKQGNRI